MVSLISKNDNVSPEDACCTAEGTGREVREFIGTAAHKARDATAAVEKQVRSNPLAASAIAAGVGFLLGSLFSRR
jgi:ElaB/YqjD/DUF883 family membrane-anchored ribosome-binding protein